MIALGLIKHHFENRTLQGTKCKNKIVSENIQLNFYSRGIAHNGLSIYAVAVFETRPFKIRYAVSHICYILQI